MDLIGSVTGNFDVVRRCAYHAPPPAFSPVSDISESAVRTCDRPYRSSADVADTVRYSSRSSSWSLSSSIVPFHAFAPVSMT